MTGREQGPVQGTPLAPGQQNELQGTVNITFPQLGWQAEIMNIQQHAYLDE